MKNSVIRTWPLAMTTLLSLLLGGCIIICNSCTTPPYKAERIVTVSGEMATDVLLSAQTNNGNIRVEGRESEGCEVTAKITARGNTEQEARDMADGVEIALVPSEGGLTVHIKKPDSELSKHIGVSLDIKMPGRNRLNLRTSNGNIDISNISLDIELHTSNGNITLSQISGPVTARTSNGNVNCHDISKDIQARTSNGNIDAVFNENAEGVGRVDLETSNGSIGLMLPKSFSAKLDASTSNGKVRSSRTITSEGSFSKHTLRGTIGAGEGTCRLHTSNGSITIR